MKLKAATVEALKASDKRQEIPDDLCTGLYLVVQPTGKKSWQVRYRHGGVHRRMTLAAYPTLTLAAARERAREVMAAASEGRDPAAEVKASKENKVVSDRNKITVLIDQYAKRHLKTLKSGDLVRRELDRFVVAEWGDLDVQSITKRDVIELLDNIADSGRLVTANRVRAYLTKFLNWLVERDVLVASPAFGVKPVAKETSRDRVLSDAEIRLFWSACEAEGYPWGALGKLLLLTGQRLNEVAQMTASEIEGNNWHLASSRTKNGKAHDVPLSQIALDVIDGAEVVHSQAGYVFSTTGKSPVSGFFKARSHLAARMEALALQDGLGEIPRWTFHDLRRTAATGMARLGVPVRVTEATLNHISGTGGGIVAVYQRHDYADEKRQALEAWSNLVAQLVHGKPENVVRIVQ